VVASVAPILDVPMLPDEPARRQALVSMRRRASLLLVAMTIVFIAARVYEDDGPGWLGYVRATAEAAMVGGLADWFAVTALFRHPLRLPIPHTAIIPTRKDQIGASLGEFLQVNFLSGAVVAERLTAAQPGARLGEWLGRPGSAAIVARHGADALTAASGALRDDEVQAALQEMVVARIRAVPVAPLAGRVLGELTKDGRHHELVDSVLRGVDRLLLEQKADLRARFARESPWWVPDPLDDRLFEKLYGGLRGFIAEVVADPRHELRDHLDGRLAELIDRLQTDPAFAARAEELKEEVLAHPALRRWTGSLWTDLKAAIVAQTADPDSTLRRGLEAAADGLGERLRTDPALAAKVDRAVADVASYVLEEYAETLADMIRTTVERWDPVVVTSQLEMLLGRDLQFIRINGTVVGGVVGLGLYTVSQLIG
jgi:uncharacterized membrane-anchored protein YjiN (DUF445 family)